MKNILIPTDFSKCADDALDFGIQYAKENNVQIISLLHVSKTAIDWVKIPKDKESNFPEVQSQITDAKHHLNQRIRKIRKNGLNAERLLVLNEGGTDYFKNTELHHYDMIIMGSHGASGPKEFMFGSNAEYLINHSNIPILIIKEAVTKPIQRIAFLSDYKDSFVKSFPVLFEFAEANQAEIDLLYISQVAFPSVEKENTIALGMNRIERYFPRKNPYTKHIIYHEDIEKATEKYCEEHQVDIISLVSTKRKGNVFGFLQANISRKIANHSKLPILILKCI